MTLRRACLGADHDHERVGQAADREPVTDGEQRGDVEQDDLDAFTQSRDYARDAFEADEVAGVGRQDPGWQDHERARGRHAEPLACCRRGLRER